MRASLLVALSIVVVLCAGPSLGTEVEQPAPEGPLHLEPWPDFRLCLGFTYAPAPQVHGYDSGSFVSRKLLDQGGVTLGLDWRLWEYVLFGFFFETGWSGGSFILDHGVRGGVLVRTDEDWAVYGLLSVGVSAFRTNSTDHLFLDFYGSNRIAYSGWGAGGALGAWWRASHIYGLFFEIRGHANRFSYWPGSSEREDYENPYMARLMLSAGVVFGVVQRVAEDPAAQAGGE